MSLADARLIEFQRIRNPKGDLAVIESEATIPFAIRRVYFLYGVPPGEGRGAHAHRRLQQLIIAVSGEFEVVLADAKDRRRFTLNTPHLGLYVPPGLWRDLEGFSGGAVCLVLASEHYDESDYIRDHATFLREVGDS